MIHDPFLDAPRPRRGCIPAAIGFLAAVAVVAAAIVTVGAVASWGIDGRLALVALADVAVVALYVLERNLRPAAMLDWLEREYGRS